jgi:UDP-hydrolysing UDP-N-acetyl-D-glucosamine 2-epimerase
MINIAYITGARSEYSLSKAFLRGLFDDGKMHVKLYVTGIHLLKKFGCTINEIKDDGFPIHKVIPIYEEEDNEKAFEFTNGVKCIYEALKSDDIDIAFVIGDRIEAYAASLACHFHKIPIMHSGGGNITEGAVDDIYRFNISNLAQIHLATSKSAYQRLLKLPLINRSNVYFTGSIAIDQIKEFQANPVKLSEAIPEIGNSQFCLMTFHPVTSADENIHTIMDFCIRNILEYNIKILVTYPNNDQGADNIIDLLKTWEEHPNVIIIKHLGAEKYYASLNEALFVIGNSSSGIIEAPYFQVPVINIGLRQQGREYDESVTDILPLEPQVRATIKNGFRNGWQRIKNNEFYGDGNTVSRIIKILKKYANKQL